MQALVKACGIKGFDPWAYKSLGKRGRDEVEAQQDKPPGLSGMTRTVAATEVHVEAAQASAPIESRGTTGEREHESANTSPDGGSSDDRGDDARQRHAREMGFVDPRTGKLKGHARNPGDDDDDGDDGGDDSEDDELSSDSDDGAASNRSNAGGQGGKKKKDKIRMLKDKQLSPPEPYDSSASTAAYRKWRERFRALISAQVDGIPWDKLLNFLESTLR